LVVTFYSRIFAFTCAKTNDRETAKDLTQDVLWAAIIAFRKGQLRQADKVPNFMLGIARNVVNSHFRSERARLEEELPDDERLSALADVRAAEQTERSMIVRDVIGQLALEEQRVLMLTLVEGMKPGDIAAHLGTTSEVIRTRKSRALKKIAKSLDSLSRNAIAKPHPPEGKL
jgi:RNA polymerase sigma factor (sigma-70 family)